MVRMSATEGVAFTNTANTGKESTETAVTMAQNNPKEKVASRSFEDYVP
jgi:hypothetical protein